MTKEDEILIIAEDEFYRNGYMATSMVTVAKRAGVTHAMVNYYFRSKEQLFLKILDKHTYSFIERLRSIMKEKADFVQMAVDAVDSLFDMLSEDRTFPSLLYDVARTAPELFERYRMPMEAYVETLMSRHSDKLNEQIEAGSIMPTTMKELLENLLILVTSSFLFIPAMENVSGFTQEQVDTYLARRKKEVEAIIKARYSR